MDAQDALVVESPGDLAVHLENTFAGDAEAGDWLRVAEYIWRVEQAAREKALEEAAESLEYRALNYREFPVADQPTMTDGFIRLLEGMAGVIRALKD